MSEFKNVVVNFLLITLFIFSLLSYIVILQEENNAVDPIKNNPTFNESFSSITENIEDITQEAEQKYDVFNKEEPKPGFGSIVLFGIVSVGKTFSNIVFGTFASIVKFPLVVLGIPSSIYNIILTILIITIIIAVWLLYKLGG